jgi:Mn2+/Fe2+ NRAMP family transporter
VGLCAVAAVTAAKFAGLNDNKATAFTSGAALSQYSLGGRATTAFAIWAVSATILGGGSCTLTGLALYLAWYSNELCATGSDFFQRKAEGELEVFPWLILSITPEYSFQYVGEHLA